MAKIYIQEPVTKNELCVLSQLALLEEEAFFKRNPYLEPLYCKRFIAAALCQGAALQYLGKGYGVADFDIHFFYKQNIDKPRLSRGIKIITADVGRFAQIWIDFIRTVIPMRLCLPNLRDDTELIQEFLKHRPTANAGYLCKRPVIGLIPNTLFSNIIWQGSDISRKD